METKYVRVPFDLKLAKKITEKYVDGRIVTFDKVEYKMTEETE